jgi:hypothetical protein
LIRSRIQIRTKVKLDTDRHKSDTEPHNATLILTISVDTNTIVGAGSGALDLLQVASDEFQGQRKTVESRAPLRTDVLLDLLPDPVVKTCTKNTFERV